MGKAGIVGTKYNRKVGEANPGRGEVRKMTKEPCGLAAFSVARRCAGRPTPLLPN